jgi:hypothetical protein
VGWLTLQIKGLPSSTYGTLDSRLEVSRPEVDPLAAAPLGVDGLPDRLGDDLAADWRGSLVLTDSSPKSFRLRSDVALRSFHVEESTIVEVDSKPAHPQELVTGDMATVYLRDGAEVPVATRILVKR